jgi:hypothetical protein
MVGEEQQRPSERGEPIQVAGKDIKRPNIPLILILVVVIGTIASFAIDYFAGMGGGSIISTAGSQVGATVAKATLVGAMTVTDAYAATHNGSYVGMDGVALSEVDTTVQWAAGGPEKGKIAVTYAGDKSFTLVYTDASGAQYTATKNQGEIVITNAAGKQI